MATGWYLIVGLLLILIGLTDTWRRELPVSAAALYLIAGHLLGPEVAGFIDLSLDRDAALLEHLTESAVLISLFAVGLKLRAPLRDRIWRAPVLMATLTMLATVALLCAGGLALGLALGPALLMAAALAPTDPVLASDVQVDHERDRDRLRFSLTAEGGLNDGTAAPMVLLALGLMGLHELGPGLSRWALVDVLWGAAGGLALGWTLGFAVSRAVVWLRREREQALGMESFLTLGLIALTYGLALLIQVFGFLAVFAAGLAMRQVERHDTPGHVGTQLRPDAQAHPEQASAYMAKAVLDFTLDLEKLAELVVMIVVGTLLTREAFTAQTVVVALAALLIARPLAVFLTVPGRAFNPSQRRLAAWFGIRGVGSMYYLAFAVSHGARGVQMGWVADAVLVTITLSVLLHGSSATPVMKFYRRARRRGA
ncbi:cation:proton antiporter [Ideonella sp. YS5]|uniref:cation:proton antiporter n=1 Tax=Ideonella sp. YS5 TaxID=3453714 RepID=UPI003EEBE842